MTDYPVLGIDVGGTNIVVAVVAEGGDILKSKKIKTPQGLSFADTAPQIKTVAEETVARAGLAWEAVGAVGLAIPSSIDPKSGVLRHAPNLGWRNEAALELCQKLFAKPLVLANDVNCGIFGEYTYGAAKGAVSAGGFFVGTGLGGGLVVDGKLIEGPHGLAGEFGHMVIKYKGRHCGCGNRGCIEAYCSKVAFGKQFNRLILGKKKKSLLTSLVDGSFDNVRSKHLAEAFKKGDPVVCRVLRKAMRKLGAVAASLSACVDVDCLVFGGGVMEALGPELMPFVESGFEANLFGLARDEVTLKLSKLGDDAVPLGAAALAAART